MRCIGANLCDVEQETIGTTRVRFALGTESVLRVGRDELTGAVMLASPTHLPRDLTIDAAAEYPPQVKYSGVGALLTGAKHYFLLRSVVPCVLTVSVGHLIKRSHVDPGFNLAPG